MCSLIHERRNRLFALLLPSKRWENSIKVNYKCSIVHFEEMSLANENFIYLATHSLIRITKQSTSSKPSSFVKKRGSLIRLLISWIFFSSVELFINWTPYQVVVSKQHSFWNNVIDNSSDGLFQSVMFIQHFPSLFYFLIWDYKKKMNFLLRKRVDGRSHSNTFKVIQCFVISTLEYFMR